MYVIQTTASKLPILQNYDVQLSSTYIHQTFLLPLQVHTITGYKGSFLINAHLDGFH